MIAFFANMFGYVLNFLYEIVGNYGLAIILFSVLVKALMLPISIKQQKTMKKSQKLNEEMKQLQFKYKNDPEKLNQEVISLYKREKMSPFSGCFSAIIQIVLLFSVFFLVRSPLTYMRKIDTEVIKQAETVVQQNGSTSNYKEIAVISFVNNLKNGISVNKEPSNSSENNEIVEEQKSETEEQTQKSDFNIEDYIDALYVNMEFIGLDLSKVPTEDLKDIKVLVIPVLYVISSFVSIKLATPKGANKKETSKKMIGDGTEQEKAPEYDPMAEANKSMTWFMPIMSISIACIAPLGLALYWLVNNILMISERIVLNKFLKEEKEEAGGNA